MHVLRNTVMSAILALVAVGTPTVSQAFLLNAPASNLSRMPAYIEASRPALAPMAHVVLCAREPRLCAERGGARSVELSATADATMRRVNRQVNRSVKQVYDVQTVSGVDDWRIAGDSGDCEDLALLKRELLIAEGFSPRALRLAVARTPWGEGHAVLVVRTSQGDLVLDNRTDAIRPWSRTDLTWLKIQSGDNPRRWLAI